MRFIDLFAGLGGFHKALHELGHECVFASELDPTLREIYKTNWGIEPKGDIKKITTDNEIDNIPNHDVLCAGFPCQPFSKAGKQLGREDDRGTLFDEIIKLFEGIELSANENAAFKALNCCGVPFRVGLSAALFTPFGTKRISASIPNANQSHPKLAA